jgi:subtilisin family serine protease
MAVVIHAGHGSHRPARLPIFVVVHLWDAVPLGTRDVEGGASVASLELVGLPPLMGLTSGSSAVVVGLLDGPVALDHPDLDTADIRVLAGGSSASGLEPNSSARQHGTFVAGILAGRRGGPAPAICPGCRLIVRPIFTTAPSAGTQVPSAKPEELAAAICECVDAGARVLNLSVAMSGPSIRDEHELRTALDHAVGHGAVIVAAAGNQGTLGSNAITRHPGVIPVVGYGVDGRPMALSNLGASAGKRGLGAPAEDVTSLGAPGAPLTLAGTSLAAPFVTGAIALLWSQFPDAPAADIKGAVLGPSRRRSVMPPLLDAWGAYQALSATQPAEVTI